MAPGSVARGGRVRTGSRYDASGRLRHRGCVNMDHATLESERVGHKVSRPVQFLGGRARLVMTSCKDLARRCLIRKRHWS